MPAPSDTAPDAPRAGLERSGGPRCSHKPLRAPGHTGLSPEGVSTHLQQKKAQHWKTDLNSDELHPQVTRERDNRGDPGPGRGQRFGVCLSTCSGDSCSDEGDCRAPGPWPATGSCWPHSGPLSGLCHQPRVVTAPQRDRRTWPSRPWPTSRSGRGVGGSWVRDSGGTEGSMGQDSGWPPRGHQQPTGVAEGGLVGLPGGTSETCVGPVTAEPASCWSASRSTHLLRTARVT